ncbi:MAG: ATP-binding cassette domain-containing protein [Bacteroidales bacterium]|nr:ATP-binding cassette domain-containing protein [Bacteroidales bacterium]
MKTGKISHIRWQGIMGRILFLHIPFGQYLFLQNIEYEDQISINGKAVRVDYPYILDKGSAIRSFKIDSIYYSNIVKKYQLDNLAKRVTLTCENLSFRFPGSENGIRPFSFACESGQLTGIMGSSGTGKTTLLNLLNGNIKPLTGSVKINGYDINRYQKELSGHIGYVPQDDLLVEELTVFENLCFSAQLCFSHLTKAEVGQKVSMTLEDLGLLEISHLPVGDPLRKFISGGQRKRLNIALEIIRQPSVLLLDEPTSGLSSSDSDRVIDLLKDQTLKGTIVVVNIHQPSSDVFKQFDKLILLDTGGYPVYFGNPLDSLIYFKTTKQKINAQQSECLSCGNVNPEQILQLIEEKDITGLGKLSKTRKTSPEEWYELYKEQIEWKHDILSKEEALPETGLNIPNLFNQFWCLPSVTCCRALKTSNTCSSMPLRPRCLLPFLRFSVSTTETSATPAIHIRCFKTRTCPHICS